MKGCDLEFQIILSDKNLFNQNPFDSYNRFLDTENFKRKSKE